MKDYKFSTFVHSYPYDGNIILLHTLSQRIIIITKENYNLIEKNRNEIGLLATIKPSLFSMLNKLGYIVDANYEEMNEVLVRYNSAIFNTSLYRMTILPTLDCNFKCWYCYEKRRNKKVMSAIILNRVKKYASNIIENTGIKHFALDWFGGEPLIGFEKVVHPLSVHVIDKAQKHNVAFSSSITTNGYLIREEWLPIFNEIQLRNFQITLDGDEKAHNKVKTSKDAYKRTIQNINLICENVKNITVMLRFNYTDDKLHTIKTVVDDIPKKNRHLIIISLQKVWQYKSIKNNFDVNIKDIYDFFRDEGFLTDSYHPQYVASCYADKKEQAVINYDGLVFKCTARDYVKSNSDGFLNSEGIIEWNQEKLNKRLATRRFHYEKCTKCNLLPMCYGPCSQKVLEVPVTKFTQICNYQGLELSLNEFLEKKYHEMMKK